eukprot:scaffold201_cov405-Prasinococcus_capsulatus_cf.AAC.55
MRAHVLEARERSADVQLQGDVAGITFEDMLLSQPVQPHHRHAPPARARVASARRSRRTELGALLLRGREQDGLARAGFVHPSPVQAAAIPAARYGGDVIVQAKAGTGKTLVFAVVGLERLRKLELRQPQVLVLAPTREIALQSCHFISSLAESFPGSQVACLPLVGGLSVQQDERSLANGCHVAVGTPGRVRALLESGALPAAHVELLVLDEADRLLQAPFTEDVEAIIAALPAKRQMLTVSATYSQDALKLAEAHMRHPKKVFVASAGNCESLAGVTQYYVLLPPSLRPFEVATAKEERVLDILAKVNFHQCIVFCKCHSRAHSLVRRLEAEGYPAAFLAGSQEQRLRMATMRRLRSFQLRVLVSTDVTARGVDLEHVNLVSDRPEYMRVNLAAKPSRSCLGGEHGASQRRCHVPS